MSENISLHHFNYGQKKTPYKMPENSTFVRFMYIYMDVVEGAGRKAKRMVLQCINGVGSNPVEGRTKI
jgi:hypothetical protein